MDPKLFRYIWTYTRREQIAIMLIVLVSMIPYYMAFDLPKAIVNQPIQGHGFETPGATLPFLDLSVSLPGLGPVTLFDGFQLDRLETLAALSVTFLAMVIVNGLFKLTINTRKGRLGERLLRRIRYDLVDRILRFPNARFKQIKAGEVSSMVKDELEPLGGFAGDAFVQPALLGGQALTAMLFIFVQHFWLGMMAAGMAAIQVLIIPRMRRALIVLGRERQVTARELAGRVAEIVDNIETVHANDGGNWERADIVSRLARIFSIRYELYQRKFMVKFLNNLISQITPFLFYAIGGYLTITDRLNVGQLVAVINAYKELPGPLKELIDWDLARQDTQMRYEQVVERFEDEHMAEPEPEPGEELCTLPPAPALEVMHVTVKSDMGAVLLNDFSLEIPPGRTVALTGGSLGGSSVLAELLGRILTPSKGRVTVDGHDLFRLPESLATQAIGYVGSTPAMFSGTILDNICYGLRHRIPLITHEDGSPRIDANHNQWHWRETARAGNPLFDVDGDWIDYDALQPVSGPEGLLPSIATVLEVVELSQEVLMLALKERIGPEAGTILPEGVLALRTILREHLTAHRLEGLVLPFEPDQFNIQTTIGENLLFGVTGDPQNRLPRIVRHPFFARTLISQGLDAELFALGWNFARITLDLFNGVADTPEVLQWLTYMTPEEMPAFEKTLARTTPDGADSATLEDRVRLIRLAFDYVEPTYRFGLLDDGLRARVVACRHKLHANMPEELRALVDRYEPARYLFNASLMENILFGKINRRYGHAEERVQQAVLAVLNRAFETDPEMRDQMMGLGLAQEVGPGGRRITRLQRSKIGLARLLIRNARFYVLNEALAGLDPALQQRLVNNILEYLHQLPQKPGVIWALTNTTFARQFSEVVEIRDGRAH
ncbi:ABC transporter transmembrane domain-containing protein [Rhodobacter lacus]|uniref:ABC transporter transmembrane domain-containing protein n=1 Tax=Rhodobacter lacus TaxID=1641972 RepID=A0ABW5A7K6_9RHOB